MSDKKTILILNILKHTTSAYFDTFFVFYFFQVANYDVVPLAKYYLTLYITIGISFFLIRNAMKQNFKASYYRIGIALEAIYTALIMLLKENIINHIILTAIVKGVAEGLYWYPLNLLNSDRINNEGRQKHEGIIHTISNLISITIPLILGILLTHFSYVEIGKVFFVLFVIMFIISFNLKDHSFNNDKIDIKGFMKILKSNKNIKSTMFKTLCAGLTYSSGVMGLIITLSKINIFKTNLNLGLVESICSILSLLVSIIFMISLKEPKYKNTMLISGIISFIATILFGIYPTKTTLIIYLIVRYSFIVLIDKIGAISNTNLSNKILNEGYKAEYYLMIDIMYSISRTLGYLLLFIVCILFGMEHINLLMIICAISLLTESILIARIYSKNN